MSLVRAHTFVFVATRMARRYTAHGCSFVLRGQIIGIVYSAYYNHFFVGIIRLVCLIDLVTWPKTEVDRSRLVELWQGI